MKSQDRQPLHQRLVKKACCGPTLALMITVILFFTFLPLAHSAAPAGQWWNNNYGLSKKITLTAGSTNVPIGYSVSFTEDTAALITNSYLRSDGNDWRIVYWNGSSWDELDRWVDDIIGDGWNSSNTVTWFKTQAGITASSSDDNYYVYYGYAGETQSAPDYMSDSMGADAASNVFWYADDFEEHAANTDPDGWTDQGTEDFKVMLHGSEKWFQAQTSNDWRNGSTASGMANVGDAVWSAKIYYHQAGSNNWGGIGVHIANGGVGRTVVVRDGAYHHEDETFSTSTWIANTDIHFPLGTRGKIELVTNGTNLDAYWYNPSGYSPERVTLFTGYTMLPGTGKLAVYVERPWTSPGNDRWIDADDVIVRQYVTSEPTSGLGPQELIPDTCPVVTNTVDSGPGALGAWPGSLRACIEYANLNAGTTIIFDIPDTAPGYTTSGGESWWRIAPASVLPTITGDGTVIDGTTQAANYGSDTNSLGPEIEVDGSGAGAGVDGLTINVPGGSATIRHMVVDNFSRDGILLQGGSNFLVGSYLGLEPDGDTLAGNNTSSTALHGGIRVESAGNTIGGTAAIDRNVISGNTLAGIVLEGVGATGNRVLGNYIGLDAGGTLDRGNISDGEGIELQDANSNSIGGTSAGARNIISGNASDGIEIDGSDLNIIQGNYIGTDYTGTVAIPNDRDGIDINVNVANDSAGNVIGGTAVGAGNLIRGNTLNGVEVRDATTINNSILGNLIYGNGQLGIDLEPVGVTANNGTTGALPNIEMDYPVLAAAALSLTTLRVEGYVGTSALKIAGIHTIEVFKAADDGGSNGEVELGDGRNVGHGEGQWYIDRCVSAADGTFVCDLTVPGTVTLANGDFVTATATDPAGNTSEFGANLIVTPNTCPVVTNTADLGGGSLRACIDYANVNPGTTISFNIANSDPAYISSGGNSWWRISPGGALPDITAAGTVIDGTTQATNYGSDTNSLGPEIEIEGTNAGNNRDGLIITGGNTTVRHLVINRYTSDGIQLTAAGGNVVQTCYLGLDPTGTSVLANDDAGILISATSASNTVGGPGVGNVISGNGASGINIAGDGNTIQGNLIGTDPSGITGLGNTDHGVLLSGAVGNFIGGQGAGEDNIMAFNGLDGVFVTGGGAGQNLISVNSIFSNGGLGIDLSPNGVASGGKAAPVFAGVAGSGANPVVTVTTDPGDIIEFFRVTNTAAPAVTPDATGSGEGFLYLGACLDDGACSGPHMISAADADGAAGTVRATLSGAGLPVGDTVTATATDALNETSQFAVNAVYPLVLVKQAVLASDGSLITNSSILPRGTVFKFLIYTDNTGPARADLSIRDVLDPAFAYSTGSLKVDNSVATGATVGVIYSAVNGTAALSDTIDADVASVVGSTIDVGNQYVGNGPLDIAANRIWALLFTVRMQ